jgi:Na+/H+ antiporter NhaD/arsenite permease-like protein
VIASERVDRTKVALLGAVLLLLTQTIEQHQAIEAIDWNTLGLLTGMMLMVRVTEPTGVYTWLAIRAGQWSQGRPLLLVLALGGTTALLSALLDNVTTVLLIVPITFLLADALDIDPIPLIVIEIFASNIGGTATLIGDPPNILIGSAAGLGFDDFLVHMAPAAVLVFLVFLVMARWFFARSLSIEPGVRDAVMALDEREFLTEPRLLRISLLVIGATMLGFLLAKPLGWEAGAVALLGAATLMLLTRADAEEVLAEVEWSTLFFFVGLFMLVESIVKVGIVGGLADGLIELTGGDGRITTLGLIWLSGIASAIIDNIPYTATMIPVVERLGESGMPVEPLWWALALGACFGGNATIVGASANVVVANVAARAGHPIHFVTFLRYGAAVTVMSLAVATVYVFIRYLA